MSPLFRNIFKRSTEPPTTTDEFLSSDLNATRKELSITQETSLALSAVWACVTLLSDSISTLPIHLYRKTAAGREQLSDSQILDLLKRPNSYTNQFALIQHLVNGCLLWGNGYLLIVKDKYENVVRLDLLKPSEVKPTLSPEKELFYKIQSTGQTIHSDNIIHLKTLTTDGIEGLSPITVHRQNLALSLSAQTFGENFYKNGGNTSGVFKHPGTLGKEQYLRLKGNLLRSVSGLQNSSTPMLLEGGMEYQRVTIPPEDAQFLGTRKFQKNEIATIYRVPPHMVGDLERSTNNNIEHQGIEYVTYSLLPYLVKIEQEFNRKLLKDSDKDQFFKFNVDALLRGSAKDRAEYYSKMFQMGMTINEIRRKEDLNPVPGGDSSLIQLNMTTLENINNGKRE